jgi:hypothetical protein
MADGKLTTMGAEIRKYDKPGEVVGWKSSKQVCFQRCLEK